MRKKVLLIVILIISMSLVSGCELIEKDYTMNEKKDMALEYLKGKYGEEFAPISIVPSAWGQGHDEIYFYPKSGTKEDSFVVWGTIKEDGSYKMHDGYFAVIIKDEYEKTMSEFVRKYYKRFKLDTDFGSGWVYADKLNKDTKINEIYNEDKRFDSDTSIYVKESSVKNEELDKVIEGLAKKMIENRLIGDIKIYVVNDTFDIKTSKEISWEKVKPYITYTSKKVSVYKNFKIKYMED